MNRKKNIIIIGASLVGALTVGVLAIGGIARLSEGAMPAGEPQVAVTLTPTPTPTWAPSDEQVDLAETLNAMTGLVLLEEASGEWSEESGKVGPCTTRGLELAGAGLLTERQEPGTVNGTWFAWGAEKTLTVPYRISDGAAKVASEQLEADDLDVLGCLLDPAQFELKVAG